MWTFYNDDNDEADALTNKSFWQFGEAKVVTRNILAIPVWN